MALDKTRSLNPDVVLMDLGMPKMSGIEATRVIHSEMPNVRIIGLSMFEEKERAAMFEAGAVDYLSKTCSVDALTTAIRRCIGKPKYRSEEADLKGRQWTCRTRTPGSFAGEIYDQSCARGRSQDAAASSRFLESEPEIEVVAEAEDGLQALQAAAEFKPDVVISDLRMEKMDGLELAREIRRLCRQPGSSSSACIMTLLSYRRLWRQGPPGTF